MFNFGFLTFFLKYLIVGFYHGVEKLILYSALIILDNLKFFHLSVLRDNIPDVGGI